VLQANANISYQNQPFYHKMYL